VLTPEKSALLASLLGGLPTTAAARLARAVEVDRLAGGRVLPHATILDALRPALTGAERTPSPQRLFCRPVEDIVAGAVPKPKQKGVIARASLSTVWNWLESALLPEATQRYVAETTQLILAQRIGDAEARAAEFRAQAAQAMKDTIARDRKSVRALFQSDLVLADAEEIALLLSAGPAIAEIQARVPRPAPHLDDETLHALRDIHDRIAAHVPDAAPYVAVIVMNRLLHPWEALKLPQLITNQTQDTLISSTDMGLVGDLLFASIEQHGNAVRQARHPVFDVEAMIVHLAQFAELSSAIVKEIDIRRDGKWGKRLLADRAAVADAMERFMERAPKEVLAMLPVLRSGAFGGGPKSADFSRPVDAEKADRGLRYARLVVGSGHYAAMGSFAAAQKDACDEIAQHLRGYNEDLIREMRGADPARGAVIARQFELAAQLTAFVFSAEEADLLRRRAKAATAAAA
jgi:hypothetical protein